MENGEVFPFRIAVAQTEVDDLKERIARTRWPEECREAAPPGFPSKARAFGPLQW
jgi:hypothetical protein